MQSKKLLSRTDPDGILRLELPTDLQDVDVEVIVVLHPLATRQTTELTNDIEQLECNKE